MGVVGGIRRDCDVRRVEGKEIILVFFFFSIYFR